MARTNKRRNLRLKIIEERISTVRSLEKELGEIYFQLMHLGYTTLEKPLRDGWYRTLVLRQDISRHKNAHVFQEILDNVGLKFWGREKKYADRARKEYYRNNDHPYDRRDIRYINKKTFMSLSSAARKHFFLANIRINFKYNKVYICTLPKYYFVTAYERAYITKRKIIAPDLERRAKEIENVLLSPKFYTLSRYNIYNYRFYYNPNKRRRRLTKTALRSLDFESLESIKNIECW